MCMVNERDGAARISFEGIGGRRTLGGTFASRFPRPDVRDLVRRLPAQAGLTLDVERASETMPTSVRARAHERTLRAGRQASPQPRRGTRTFRILGVFA